MDSIIDRLPGPLVYPLKIISNLMKAIVIFSGVTMACTFVFVVVIRTFGGNLFAFEEWLMTICFWGFFMGAALASEKRLHINADIFSVMITNSNMKWWRDFTVLVLEFVITVIIAYWAYLMIRDEVLSYPVWQTTAALKIPFITWRTGIFIAFIFMSVFSLAHLYVHCKDRSRLISSSEGQSE